MRNLLARVGVLGSVSAAFGSMLLSQKSTESDKITSSTTPAGTHSSSPYELKLVQVLFRHGARTPLKSIPNVMEVRLFVYLCIFLFIRKIVSHNSCVKLCMSLSVWSQVQWVPTLLEPPAHTHINYVVTDLHGGPRPSSPAEESYRKNVLTVSRCRKVCTGSTNGK